MNVIDLFRILILKIDLTHVNLGPAPNYEGLRQQLGLTIDAALAGPRAGQWIGGRTKKKKIYLFFKVSDPPKARNFIMRSLDNHGMLGKAKIRIKAKRIKSRNIAVV
ncbi:MAG: hypothetical protein PVG51_11760 [Desulfosarcina sp.]|jgi:hypothetical protein